MNARWLNYVVSAAFLVVGILATANMIRFNRYVAETLPRDQAQEVCNARTIEVLKSWLVARGHRDAAMDARDDAAVVVLDAELNGLTPTPQQIGAWRDAVTEDRRVRTTEVEKRLTLPIC